MGDELDRAVERLEGDLTACGKSWLVAVNKADLRLILAANRKMREAASLVLDTNDRIVDAMLAAKDERTAASISLKGSDEFTATLAVLRSALTTQTEKGS